MRYKDMVGYARANGLASEDSMNKSIERVDEMLEALKESHPKMYWKFMRKSHEELYGPHYNEEFAKYDVENLCYTDANGREHCGAHWTLDETTEAFRGRSLSANDNEFDVFVSLNNCYADCCKKFTADDIIEMCYLFFFADEDGIEGKIWRYMSMIGKYRTEE